MISTAFATHQKVSYEERLIEDDGNEGAKDPIVKVVHYGIHSAGCVTYLSLRTDLTDNCTRCRYEKLSRFGDDLNPIILEMGLQGCVYSFSSLK